MVYLPAGKHPSKY